MRPKLLLLFIFGLFIFVLPSGVEAYCNASILRCAYNYNVCTLQFSGPLDLTSYPYVGITSQSSGQYESEPSDSIYQCCGSDITCTYPWGTSTVDYCSDSDGWTASTTGIPNVSSRLFCTVIHNRYVFPGCIHCVQPGLFDATAGKCVRCSDTGNHTEARILGTTSTLYNPCSNPPGIVGDGNCESVCAASPECDEVTPGSTVSGGTCNSNCVFVPGPAIGFSPYNFTFTAVLGGSNPASQTLEVWNSGTSGTTLNWSVSDNATWLTLSPTSGNSTGEHDSVTLSVSISGMTAGSYSATITISDPNASNSPQTVPVTLTITAPDLQITYIVFDSSKRVNYSIYNYGTAAAVASRSYLYVDGSYETYDSASSLNANTGSDDYFLNWTACETGLSYSIEVCADRAGPNGAVAGTGQTVIESDETNNCKTQSLTCPACSGAVSLALSPNPANPSVTITATVSGLSICEDTPARIRQGSCSGTTKCTCYISGGGCSCTFTGPASTTTYYACVDKNADGDYSDTGEQDSEELIVQTCTGTQTVTISGSGTCTVTASLTATGCSGQSWQIQDGSTIKCQGTVSSSPYSNTCTNWTVGSGTTGTAYTYNLYIGGVSKDSDSVTCPSTPNNPPTCNAGSDKTVNENTSTTLDGSASDPDGDSLSYSWSCTGGSLNNSSILQPTYTAPSVTADTDYTCTLNVSDGKGGNCSDPMIVHVKDVPAGVPITSPSVTTISATATKTSATLNGYLNSLGYETATCTNCQCIVWFEWGTSGTAGVSGSYGNSTTPISMNGFGPFTAVISGLTSGQTYYFEAFAKNGGSW